MSRAEKRKHHYIYKTICIITNKFYIGMHSTDNLKDGYQGSGKLLWHSIRKHGKENHVTEILEFLPSREELKLREARIVNEELLNDAMCINLCLGGEGGWESHNKNPKNRQSRINGAIAASKVFNERFENDLEFRTRVSAERSLHMKENHADGKYKYDTFSGKFHSEETIRLMRESHLGKHIGEKNSQFGTCWIYSLEECRSMKINKEEISSYLNLGWKKGRKKFG